MRLSGPIKPIHKNARKFLEEVGVEEIGDRQLVMALMDKQYSDTERPFEQKTYLAHLKRFMKLAKEEEDIVRGYKKYKLGAATVCF